MADCKNCEHSAFDPLWGEYKCKVKAIRIYDTASVADCADYKKKVNKKES